MINWNLSKQRICWTVLRKHITGSSLELIEGHVFFDRSADQVLLLDWIAGSYQANLLKARLGCINLELKLSEF